MNKKLMKRLEEKFDCFYQINNNQSEDFFFLLKAIILKFLDNNDQIDFFKNQGVLKKRFTFDHIFEIWNCETLKQSFYPEKIEKIKNSNWEWILDFVKDTPLLKGENTDIIGEIYEKQLMPLDRKRQGIFYTPRTIADFMVLYCSFLPTLKTAENAKSGKINNRKLTILFFIFHTYCRFSLQFCILLLG